MTIRNEPKWTITVIGGIELLQMISELDTERCAIKDTEPPRRVDYEIPHWLERGTKHSL